MFGLYFQQSKKDSNPLLKEIFLTWEKQHRVYDFKEHIEKIEAKRLTIRLFRQLHAVAQGIDLTEDFSNVFQRTSLKRPTTLVERKAADTHEKIPDL